MQGLRPVLADPIWHVLTPDRDIVMEPTVGGKTAAEMRVSCRGRCLFADLSSCTTALRS